MKYICIGIALILLGFVVGCQADNKSKEVKNQEEQINKVVAYTPEVEKKIKQSITEEIKQLGLKLRKQSLSEYRIQFMMDTFKIVQFRNRKMEYLFSTQDMNEIVHNEMNQYDLLMNKYYHKLYARLEGLDKEILKTAQKAWLDYRDKEIILYSTLRDEKYSGGGTVQSNIFTGLKCDLTRQRMNELFEHSCMDY